MVWVQAVWFVVFGLLSCAEVRTRPTVVIKKV